MKKFLYKSNFWNILFHREPYIGSLNPYSLATVFFLSFFWARCLPLAAESYLPFVFLPLGAGFVLPCLVLPLPTVGSASIIPPDNCLASLWSMIRLPLGQGFFWLLNLFSFGSKVCQEQSVFGAESVPNLKQDSVKKHNSISNSYSSSQTFRLADWSGFTDQSRNTVLLSQDTDVIYEIDPCQSSNEACTTKLLLYKCHQD